MKKELNEMVWPVENYTDKIHTGIKSTFATYKWLSFTIPQLKEYLTRGYPWLNNPTEKQTILLEKLIKTGITKLIQTGKVKKVSSNVSVDPQWQSAETVSESGFTNVTSDDEVAQTEAAKKAIGRRSIGGRSLWKLNQDKAKLGLTH